MNVTVREATEKDIFDILVLGRSFSREAGHLFRYDPTKTQQVFSGLIRSPDGCIFVMVDEDDYIVGGIIGVLNHMPFSTHVVATELAWFVDDKFRGNKQAIQLVNEFEKWANAKGAEYAIMSHIHAINDLGGVYDKLGYSPTETSYSKRL